MDSQRTDKAFDRALTKGLRRQAETGTGCPGPDIMAAFWDRSLSLDERPRWEAHFAGCERCQAQLAALARTAETETPTADSVASHLGWLFDWRWFAAISTAAIIVVALWVADPARLTGGDTPTVADSESVRLAEDAPAERAQAEEPAAPAPAEPRSEAESLQTRARVAQRENVAAEADTATVDEVARRDQQTLAASEEARRLAGPEAEATVERRPAEPGAVRGVVGGVAGAEFTELADTDASLLVSVPNSSVLWRIMPGGAIERSTDAGASWVVQLANPGTPLTAGSAPSDSVCWLVGQTGAVFRTTDGMTWERLSAPTSADLMRVEAEDALTAVVTTADGTAYRTADGGQTWASQ